MCIRDSSITLAAKPRYFTETHRHLEVEIETGKMTNRTGPLQLHGVYQGGNAQKLEKDFNLRGDEILYIGDHIFGDIVSLKRSCEWRTALVIEELDEELSAFQKGISIQNKIEDFMKDKEVYEEKLDELYSKEFEHKEEVQKELVRSHLSAIQEIDTKIADTIKKYQENFNAYWGEIMRAGQEESRFAGQVEKLSLIHISEPTRPY